MTPMDLRNDFRLNKPEKVKPDQINLFMSPYLCRNITTGNLLIERELIASYIEFLENKIIESDG